MAAISQTTFSSAFQVLNENIWIFNNISLINVPWDLIGSIGSDNGLAPNRRQAIFWNSVGVFYWRIYTSLGLDELSVIPDAFKPVL